MAVGICKTEDAEGIRNSEEELVGEDSSGRSERLGPVGSPPLEKMKEIP